MERIIQAQGRRIAITVPSEKCFRCPAIQGEVSVILDKVTNGNLLSGEDVTGRTECFDLPGGSELNRKHMKVELDIGDNHISSDRIRNWNLRTVHCFKAE
ncbi:hypothetical protein A2Y99_02755 [Candidatus Gottesmanbacteria bacterium RBG_13_37_7]|uniref:Uncharacterized protein n=1 Tax=Candidatus Gottesmanbacteria bacterium RBG_13_37_7 TaxID=1798369 RepID=A0A1F5YJZ3_9BACT|nr:MAG: hypothetical protein A2Y99_02755 [Candidatus Gottesmanbacteria bacterium RBG_13_37_7]